MPKCTSRYKAQASYEDLCSDSHNKKEQAAIKDAAERLNAIGVPACTLAFDPNVAQRYIDYGFQLVCAGSVQSCLMGGLAGFHKRFLA